MIKTELGKLQNKSLVLYQCQSADEAQKEGLPTGCYWYWLHGDRKITMPSEVIKMVITEAESGTLDVQKLSNPSTLQDHFNRLRSAQMAMVKQNVENIRENALKSTSLTPEQREQISKHYDNLIKNLEKPDHFPGMDGFATEDHMKKMQDVYAEHPVVTKLGTMPGYFKH